MKKYLVILILSLSAICAKAETVTVESQSTVVGVNDASHQLPKADLNEAYKNTPEWGKYRSLRTVGWTLLGVGLGTGVGGLVTAVCIGVLSDNSVWPGVAVAGVGAGLTVASVPILITAYHNRAKAKKIGLSMGVTSLSVPSFDNNMSTTPGLNFTLTF